MSKRRRAGSIASSRGQEDDLDESNESISVSSYTRKRRRADPSELCQQLYDVIRNYKKEDGTLLCDAFIRAPKRRQEPGYYEVVSNPIDLLRVQQKIKMDEYEDTDELALDIDLMVKNAKAFYKKNSQEYRDACDMWELFLNTKNKRSNSERGQKLSLDTEMTDDTRSEASSNTQEDENPYEDLFSAVMLAADSDGRPYHTPFQLLPSKKRYPEYYDVIENPIDLKKIAKKIQGNEYNSLTDMEKDLLTMTKNACTFNEPGSQIYKDAKCLKKIISSKKIEIDHGKYTPNKSSDRIRNRRLRGGVQTLSAVTAALKNDESDGDDDQDEDQSGGFDPKVDLSNPQWVLFEALRNATNAHGAYLCEPFWRLPNRRFYPDYYKEIKNLISLSKVRSKIIKGFYGNLGELAGDLNIMFENAKKYNIKQSTLYKDTCKLQKVMQAKFRELIESEQESDSDTDSMDIRGKRTPGSSKSGQRMSRGVTALRKRLQNIVKSMVDYCYDDGRQPLLFFMEKPSRKVYSDYYDVITEPIDVITIKRNIKNEKYSSEDDLLSDFRLMFSNCRHYNEPGSMIYEDSIALERVLMEKTNRDFVFDTPSVKDEKMDKPERKTIARTPRPRKILTQLEQNMRTLCDAVRDYRDPKTGRQLAIIFMKLPTPKDYPEYYEVIKKPIDLERISAKIKSCAYDTMDELVADLILMFENACKFNEPDSQIYKDALVLQRVCLQTKQTIMERENEGPMDQAPDVQAAVQDLLGTLFTAVYNHQTDDGRFYSDSMSELPEHDDVDGKKVRALSLDLIKRRLDRGVYKRLDVFQDDFFACLERARQFSVVDSQVFNDSVALQSFFIRQRDEICRGGDLLTSPALLYTLVDLQTAIEIVKQTKLKDEIKEEADDGGMKEDGDKTETDGECSGEKKTPAPKENIGDSMTCNQRTFRVGEFVYVDPKEKGMDASIIFIERLWTNTEGQQMLYGNYFMRPGETYHVSTRTFFEKEVFKSDSHAAIPLNEVRDRCWVMFFKDYVKYRPEGYDDKDVYVCESRYATRARMFKKIKNWTPSSLTIKLIERPDIYEPRRVCSVFRERIEKHKDELAELAEQERLVEKEKPNIIAFNVPDAEEGNIYYEQYNTLCSGVVKTGDFVYAIGEGSRQLITQIDAIWETKDGKSFFRGPWMFQPVELPNLQSKMFFKKEVFVSTTDETFPIVTIVGKCSVLEYNDYISSRLTEIPEADVYVCEEIYDEVTKEIKKIPPEGLKRYQHSMAVTEDEIYFFKKLINPQKYFLDTNQCEQKPEIKLEHVYSEMASPMSSRIASDVDTLMEDSMDGNPPSVGSGDYSNTGDGVFGTPSAYRGPSTPNHPKSRAKGAKTGKDGEVKKKLVTGYILYSSEVRKHVAEENPNCSFGEISRLVGNDWRSLPIEVKQSYEEKAQAFNEERQLQQHLASIGQTNVTTTPTVVELKPNVQSTFIAQGNLASTNPGNPGNQTPTDPNERLVYECCWQECDYQFEDLNDCFDHVLKDSGHVNTFFRAMDPPVYECHWRQCVRLKRNMSAFPHMPRLMRHVKEVHIQRSNGRQIPVDKRSKNYTPSKRHQAVATNNQLATLQAAQLNTSSGQSMANQNQTINSVANATGRGNKAKYISPRAPPEPMFVAVPPRPTRVFHSEAYIKYIEGLQANNKYINSWERQLNANSKQRCGGAQDISKLPRSWFKDNAIKDDKEVVNALWQLRDIMFRDALNLRNVHS